MIAYVQGRTRPMYSRPGAIGGVTDAIVPPGSSAILAGVSAYEYAALATA